MNEIKRLQNQDLWDFGERTSIYWILMDWMEILGVKAGTYINLSLPACRLAAGRQGSQATSDEKSYYCWNKKI